MDKKIVLVGDAEVGKTQISQQYVHEQFYHNYESTIGVEFSVKNYNVDHQQGKLTIWDTTGQERFRAITNAHYRGAHLVMVVFDVTNRESFEHTQNWIDEAREQLGDEVPIVLVGNKVDKKGERAVTEAEAKEFAEKNGLGFYCETSAKNDDNIDKLFEDGIRLVLNEQPQLSHNDEDENEYESASVEDYEADQNNKALAHITSYAEALTKLKTNIPSKNNNKAGQTKGQNLQTIFGHGEPSKETLEDILVGNQYEGLLDNRSRGPSLYKIWSLLTRHRNEFMDNRLCESKTEALLVDYYQQTY